MKLPDSSLIIIIATGVTLFASLVHATNTWRQKRENKEPFTPTDFFIGAFTASFSGLICGLLAFAVVAQNIIVVALCAGLGAFMGMTLLNQIGLVFVELLKNLLTLLLKGK